MTETELHEAAEREADARRTGASAAAVMIADTLPPRRFGHLRARA